MKFSQKPCQDYAIEPSGILRTLLKTLGTVIEKLTRFWHAKISASQLTRYSYAHLQCSTLTHMLQVYAGRRRMCKDMQWCIILSLSLVLWKKKKK